MAKGWLRDGMALDGAVWRGVTVRSALAPAGVEHLAESGTVGSLPTKSKRIDFKRIGRLRVIHGITEGRTERKVTTCVAAGTGLSTNEGPCRLLEVQDHVFKPSRACGSSRAARRCGGPDSPRRIAAGFP